MMLSLMNTAKPCSLRPSRSGLKKNMRSHTFLVPNIEAEDNKIGADHFTLASQLATFR